MHRKFIATVMAAAIAVTTIGAAPAKAGAKELARFIVGVAALGVIAAAINDADRKENRVARQDHAPVVVPPRHERPARLEPRPLPDRARVTVLPAQCVRQVSDRRGTRNVFMAGCLERNDVRMSRLPERCEMSVIGQRGHERTAYDARCLSNNGYRVSRR